MISPGLKSRVSSAVDVLQTVGDARAFLGINLDRLHNAYSMVDAKSSLYPGAKETAVDWLDSVRGFNERTYASLDSQDTALPLGPDERAKIVVATQQVLTCIDQIDTIIPDSGWDDLAESSASAWTSVAGGVAGGVGFTLKALYPILIPIAVIVVLAVAVNAFIGGKVK